MGLYNSTKNAINILNEDSKYFLPRTSLYFGQQLFVLDNEGDKLALEEFNKNTSKRISNIGELSEQLSLFWRKWIFLGKRLKVLSDLKHPKYNQYYEPKLMKILNKNLP